MKSAILDNDIVTNIIWLYPTTSFPNSVPCYDYPVAVGDTYSDGRFYRNGHLVLSALEAQHEADEAAHLAELGALIEEIYSEDLEVIG